MQVATESNAMTKELEAMLAALNAEEHVEAEQASVEEKSTEQTTAKGSFDEQDLLNALSNLTVADTEELSTEELGSIEAGEVRAQVYSTQTSNIDPTTPAPLVRNGKARPRVPSAAGKPRVERDLGALPPETFMLFASDDPAAAKIDVLANKPTQKKIIEKWENLFITLSAGAEPSKFTVTGFKLLKAKGTMTSADLIAAMKTEGLGDGTARSQTGQIMALLPLLGVAIRSGQVLTLRADSLVAEKLSKILKV